jgi:integrase
MLKGMNTFMDLEAKQTATHNLLSDQLSDLKKGYNPFDVKIDLQSSSMNFVEALKYAFSKITIADSTRKDILLSLNSFEKTIIELGLNHFNAEEISRKHIRLILDKSCKTDYRFNKNRSYMMILLSTLCEIEIISTNFVRDIKKRKVIKKLRMVLNEEERTLVDNHLKNNYPTFHRFLHIFFHSGARISELLRLKGSDVDLKKQRIKLLIQKGTSYREVWRTIKTVALPYWMEQMDGCLENHFIFSNGLIPGEVSIQPYQINKRWYRLVKKQLKIKADFYSLKHLHTTEVVELLGEMEAARHNGHTSVDMVSKVYDVRKEGRIQQSITNLKNTFS